MHDLKLKLLALLIALGLAVFVSSTRNFSVVTVVAPVGVKNLPDDRVILMPADLQAQVTLRGPSFLLSRVFSSPPRFEILLPDNVQARHRAVLPIADLNLPSSVQVEKVQPSEIEFLFDRLIETSLKVEVPLVGSVQSGFRLEGIEIEPPAVPVSGAATELRGLKSIQTTPLILQDMAGNAQEELRLKLPGRFTRSRRESVIVRIRVSPLDPPKGAS